MKCLPFGFAPTKQTLWDRLLQNLANDNSNGFYFSQRCHFLRTVAGQGYSADGHYLSLDIL